MMEGRSSDSIDFKSAHEVLKMIRLELLALVCVNTVRAPKTANPVLQERVSSGCSLLIREWYRLVHVSFCEMVSDQRNVLVAVG